MTLEDVQSIVNRIDCSLFDTDLYFIVSHDKKFENGRIYIQIEYRAPCVKTGEYLPWHGRKWYLSDHMTEDEVIKTAFCAFEAAVKHEILEGFKVDGVILFNPHVNYKRLLQVSPDEVYRQ